MRTFTEKLTDLSLFLKDLCLFIIYPLTSPRQIVPRGPNLGEGGGGGGREGFNSRPLTQESSATSTVVLLLVASFASVFTREKSLNENCVLENVAEQILVNEFTMHRKEGARLVQ